MKKLALMLVLLIIVIANCGKNPPPAAPTTIPSPSIPPGTSTIPASPLPPTLTITPVLIDGTLTIKVNVRSGPGTTYDSLGQLEAGSKVQVIARDGTGKWYKIFYPSTAQEYGWIASQFVTITAGTGIPQDATPTPAGPMGQVIQRLNVRAGPGTTFDLLGVLEAGAAVSLTGKNSTASWFQIDYPAGPGGQGWVTSQYVQTDATPDLPLLDDLGHLVTPGAAGTASGPILASTPTVGPAIADGDSFTNPAVKVIFTSGGTHLLIYSSQVSTPQGDAEDWVSFTPYSLVGTDARLNLSLECTGNTTLKVELWQGSTLLSGWGSLACGDTLKSIHLPAGKMILVHLTPVPGDGLHLVAYTLIVKNNP